MLLTSQGSLLQANAGKQSSNNEVNQDSRCGVNAASILDGFGDHFRRQQLLKNSPGKY